MENTFPQAFVDRVNSMNVDGITAESVTIGSVREAKPCGYTVIVDRISHDVPFYRAYLKNGRAHRHRRDQQSLLVERRRQVFQLRPGRETWCRRPEDGDPAQQADAARYQRHLVSHLQYPYDWQAAFDYVGFPAFLKTARRRRLEDVFHVHDSNEFFEAYDQTRTLCMTLQAAVKFREYFRCYVVGQRDVRIMPYDPSRPHADRYVINRRRTQWNDRAR